LSGRASRRKGHDYERQLARLLRDVFPQEGVKRGFQTRFGGKEEADVVVPHFHLEAKRQKQPNIRAALRQAVADSQGGKVPIAITKGDRDPDIVSMRLEDWMALVAEWWSLRRKEPGVSGSNE